MSKNVYMGTTVEQWMSTKKIKYITFNVTDDCNLACKYCYFTHKTNKKRMSFDIAKQAIDTILSSDLYLENDGVVWDFIGGEPTLELDLIERICDYILYQLYIKSHKWLYCYRFMIGTNGLLYSSPKMQKLIQKYGMNLQVAMTIDGSKEKHDLSRVKKDGSGSYNDVVAQVPLWKFQQGANSTKATFAHDDLPYLKDSIINLWNLGIKNVMANVVFENVWHEGDDIIFKEQLIALADYIVDNNLWDKCSVRFFNPDMGMPAPEYLRKRNFCGTGKMLAISTDGKFYPCARFLDSALNNHKGVVIGDIFNGIDNDKVRAFKALDTYTQSSNECLNCDIATGCTWCSGLNYDDSEIGTIFERKTYHCKMHKANVEACRYLWKRYEEVTGNISPMRRCKLQNTSAQHKFMYIILNNHVATFCNYENKRRNDSLEVMDEDTLKDILTFCDDNNFSPIFIGEAPDQYKKLGYTITDNCSDNCKSFSTGSVVSNDTIKSVGNILSGNIILSINKSTLPYLYDDFSYIVKHSKRVTNISVAVSDLMDWNKIQLQTYREQLELISKIVMHEWLSGNRLETNIITHIFHHSQHKVCSSGTYTLTVAPNKKLYLCPAFYFEKCSEIYDIGSIDTALNNKYFEYCKIEKSKLCAYCDANHCTKCIFVSKAKTNEFCVPPEILCLKSNIEREVSKAFLDAIAESGNTFRISNHLTKHVTMLDPLERI